MIELKPLNENDFDLMKSWIQSEEELVQFAGPLFTYPLTDDQLLKYINMKDRKSLKVILSSSQEMIGHCELNFANGKNRLSRILIGNKKLRGQKIGEQIVRKMVEMLFQNPKVNVVDLNVFDWNKMAIRCYEKVGFKINHNQRSELNIKGHVWTRLNMSLMRE